MTGPLAPLRAHAWIVIVLAGLLVGFIYLEGSTLTKAVALLVTYAAVAVALAGRLYAERRGYWLPWLLLLIWAGCWCGAWSFWQAELLGTGGPPSTSSWINLVFLAGNFAVASALALLLIRREPDLVAGLDAAIVAAAFLLVAWVFLITDDVNSTGLPLLGRCVQISYAFSDVLTIALVVRVLVSPGRRSPAIGLTLAGALGILFSDGVWNWSTQLGAYTPGSWADLGWLLSAAVLTAAAVHPAARGLYGRGSSPNRRASWGRMSPLAGALLTPALVLALSNGLSRMDVIAISAGSAILGLLVLARVTLILLDQSRFAKLDAMKDAFVASVSHELRTPLTSIRGYLELVLDGGSGPLTNEQKEHLGVVDRNADRLLMLVGDILDVAQTEAGQMQLDLKPCDVSSLAAEAVHRAKPTASAEGVDLTCHADTGVYISADSSRISQTLDNLISNAIKFTPAPGRVDVSVSEGPGFAQIAVADTGIGIAVADQPQLSQRFFRTSDATARAIPGTGLGLWITKAIIEAHGGRLSVESEQGVGTTVQIKLPITHRLPANGLARATAGAAA